jgi:hypothetical protein
MQYYVGEHKASWYFGLIPAETGLGSLVSGPWVTAVERTFRLNEQAGHFPVRKESPMSDSFSAIEMALLSAFRLKGARAGAAVPTDVLAETVYLSGGAPVLTGAVTTALYNLQFRGLIVPGPDPFSAMSWALTKSGAEIVNSES